MNRSSLLPVQRLLCIALLLVAGAARAESYGLLLWIGNYAEPSAKLQGIRLDAELARDMLRLMGVPRERTVELSDEQLDFATLRAALVRMRERLRPADTLVIYFSGHGKRLARAAQPGCQEGIVTVDGRLFLDALLQPELEALAGAAGRVIMFNDSCHSGGAATKRFDPDAPAAQPKAYPLEPVLDEPVAKGGASNAPDSTCTTPVNRSKAFGAPALPQDRMFYLAASADDEVAWATPQGSLATRAWHACLADPRGTDSDGDGRVSGAELAACASAWIARNEPKLRQTITPQFNAQLTLATRRR